MDMTTNEALVATTTRNITMAVREGVEVVRDIRTFPAGTEVYVTRIRGGQCKVRVCGSLYTQTVSLSSITPA